MTVKQRAYFAETQVGLSRAKPNILEAGLRHGTRQRMELAGDAGGLSA